MSKKRKVAIVAPSAYLIGGVQTWLDYLVPGLDQAGWEITVLLVHGTQSDAHLYLNHHPFPSVQLVSNPTGSREGRVLALGKSIRSSGADLVVGVNIADVYEAVGRLRRYEGSDTRVTMALHGFNRSFFDDILAWNETIDGVIATNRLAVAAAARFGGVSVDRVFYAPCGVLIPSALQRQDVADELVLLYSGRFSEEKRVLDLPSILRALDRRGVVWRLQLAGSGPSEAELRVALAEFGPKVEFAGIMDPVDICDSFLRAGSIALILSPSESGPLAAWEAMANGVAVVTSRFYGIGLEGSLRDGETCLTFPVGDSESAAAAVARLADPLLRDSLIDAGYRLVKERYSREVSIRAWDRALRQILKLPLRAHAPAPGEPPPAGRLDSYLGARMGETVRRLLGLRFSHSEPGGEWPHAYGRETDEHFSLELGALDGVGDSETQCKKAS